MTRKVACSEFVKRQTKDSGYSHFEASWEELSDLVEYVFIHFKDCVTPGYKDGVVLVSFPGSVNKFKSAIVKINEKTNLFATYAPRLEGESPFIRIATHAKKQEARYVSVVLYRADILDEDGDRSTGAEWEIIAIKARASEEEDPMDPYTMARNFLHLKGGTKGNFTAEQFAKSIVYWNNNCMTIGKVSWWSKLKKWSQKYNDEN